MGTQDSTPPNQAEYGLSFVGRGEQYESFVRLVFEKEPWSYYILGFLVVILNTFISRCVSSNAVVFFQLLNFFFVHKAVGNPRMTPWVLKVQALIVLFGLISIPLILSTENITRTGLLAIPAWILTLISICALRPKRSSTLESSNDVEQPPLL